MILTENKNTIHFKHRLLPNCLSHDLEIVTVNGGDSTSQYHIPLAVAKLTGRKKYVRLFYRHTTYNHSNPPSVEIKHAWSYTSAPSIPSWRRLRRLCLPLKVRTEQIRLRTPAAGCCEHCNELTRFVEFLRSKSRFWKYGL
jgi:hypothetical protein